MTNLAARDRAVIWHPFTNQKNQQPPIAVARAEKTLLFDEQGVAYIDAISSWWVNLHGHAHPYIAQKIYEQALRLEHVIFAGFTHEPAVQLAERLLPLLPGNFSKIFYSDDGSTSVEVAVKMALQYWKNVQDTAAAPAGAGGSRTRIIAFNNSYHGDTFGAMSVSDRSVFTAAFHDHLFEVIFIDTPSAENINSLQHTVRMHAAQCAAFIYEPLVQGAGGIKMYDAALMDTLLATVQEQGILCIADEVMTGFGRTGKLFACEHLRCKPDIICLSKGLTGGTMALGVTACSEKIYSAFVSQDPAKTFFHGHSFTANPIACSAALASLDLLQQTDCAERIAFIGEQNQHFLETIKLHPKVKNARSLGTIAAFELVTPGRDEYLNNAGAGVTAFATERGVYLRPLGNTVYLMPPYCITATELEQVYAVIREYLASEG
jgi:adenosylmethionine---8-amino-7-oxononanoate aminotransferase